VNPFFFSVRVPEGNYRVRVKTGNPSLPSETTVKSEARRLMTPSLATEPGGFATIEFIANVRTPAIPGGGGVTLNNPRETVDKIADWDEKLTLEFNGRHPRLVSLEIEPVDLPTVFILGDSTVSDQGNEPYASWGQMLPRFFKPTVAVANHAESGESLARSTATRRLDKVLSLLKPGDFVLIQFGHNDMKSKAPDALAQYRKSLEDWVDRIRKQGGLPVLVTSVHRHSFQGNSIANSLRDYPETVRQVAKEKALPLIDLHASSKILYEAFGPDRARVLFKSDSPDDANFDHTHHNSFGAYEIARCVVNGIQDALPSLAQHLTKDLPRFDPARPDDPAAFPVPPSPGSSKEKPLGN